MKKCKYCKSEIDKKAKICPHCGKKQKGVGAIFAIIIVVIVAVVLVAALGGEDGEADKETSIYETPQKIYEDDNLSVEFLKAYEEDSIDGVFYLQLDVKNGFDRRVMIYLEEPTVNDYSTLTMSGIPMEIDAGARSKNPFFYNEDNVGMENLEDLKTIKFVIGVYDADTMTKLFTSEPITIDFTD